MTHTKTQEPISITKLEAKSHVDAGSSAEKTQGLHSSEGGRIALQVRAAIENESEQFWLNSLNQTSPWSTQTEDAAIFQSIAEVILTALRVNVNNIRAWSKIYGPAQTLALVLLGRKTVWKLQAELLGRRDRPFPDDSGDPGDPDDFGNSDGHDPEDPGLPGRTYNRAEKEYKKTIEAESGRITISATIIAQIAVTVLALPSLSQTHWVARSSWLFSFVAGLLAVYFANNQAGKMGYLLFGSRLRAWIRGRSKEFDDYIRETDEHPFNVTKLLIRSLVPAPSSVLMMSAPGVLLSASLYFLLIGFGIYLGFMWTRNLDDLAGPKDSRDVFIVYLVSLSFCYGLYSISDAAHDRQVSDTVRETVQHSLLNSIKGFEISKGRREEKRKPTEGIKQRLLLEQQAFLSRQMLDQLKETQALMNNLEENQILVNSPMWEDSDGRTPLSWAAERGKRFVVLALLEKNRSKIDAQDNLGRTPLLWAAANGHVAVVKDLLSRGANAFIEDHQGRTAFELARGNEQEAVIELLQSWTSPVLRGEDSG